MAVSVNAGFVTKRFFDRLTETNANIFDSVMLINMKITVTFNR